VLETDASVLVAQLNRLATDLPGQLLLQGRLLTSSSLTSRCVMYLEPSI